MTAMAKKMAKANRTSVAPVTSAGIDTDMKGHAATAPPCPAEQSFITPTCEDAKHTTELASSAKATRRTIPILFLACMIGID
jgi:hypothetical protein